LHNEKKADITLNSQTLGLTSDPTTLELNNILRKMQKWQKLALSTTTWLDKQSYEALSEKMFALYMD
jgi:hypothetical protein